MNFLKQIFYKVTQTKEKSDLKEDNRYTSSYRCELYQQDITTQKIKLISKTSQVLFDENVNMKYDHIMIIRINDTLETYNDRQQHKTANYYFTMSQLVNLEEQINNNIIQLSWMINQTQKGILRFKNQNTTTQTNDQDYTYEKFRIQLLEFLYENNYQICYDLSKKKALDQLIKKLPPIVQMVKDKDKRNPYPNFEPNYVDQFIKSMPQEPNIIKQQLDSVKRNSEEKSILNDQLLLVQANESVIVLFSGSLYIMREQQLQLLQKSVILSIHQYQEYKHTLEIRNTKNQLIISDHINQSLNYNTDHELRFLKWLHLTDTQADVLLIRFDGMDSTQSARVYIEQIKIQKQQKQNSKKQISQDQKIWTEQYIQDETLQINYGLEKDLIIPEQQVRQYKDNYASYSLEEGKNELQNNNLQMMITNESLIISKNNEIRIYFLNSQSTPELQQTLQVIDKNGQSIQINSLTHDLKIISSSDHIYHFDPDSQKVIQDQKLQKVILDVSSMTKFAVNGNETKFQQNNYYLFDRQNIFKLSDEKFKEVYSHENLSALCVSQQNSIIIGTQTGELIILSDQGVVLNEFPPLAQSIIGIELSEDEKLLLVTHQGIIHLFQCNSQGINGLQYQYKQLPLPIKLEISPEDMCLVHQINKDFANYILDNDNLTKAHFGQGQIISTCGPFIFIWNISSLLKGEKYEYQVKLNKSPVSHAFILKNHIITLSDEGVGIRKQVV